MKLERIEAEKECWKRIEEQEKGKFLPYIFRRRLFPSILYFPTGSFAPETQLIPLFQNVCAMHTMPDVMKPSIRKIAELSLSDELLIRNQEDIFEETGEIIVVDRVPAPLSQTNNSLSNLYPDADPYYELFCPAKMRGKLRHVLIQAGFLRKNALRLTDTLPEMETIILRDEKTAIFPVFEDILEGLLFVRVYPCMN